MTAQNALDSEDVRSKLLAGVAALRRRIAVTT